MTVSEYKAQAEAASAFLMSRFPDFPTVAIILGTGLDRFTDAITIQDEVAFEDIPHFPVSTVSSHTGSLAIGTFAGKPLAVVRGRVHLYEGYDSKTITLPVRTLALAGVKTLLITNACGSMNPQFHSGDIVMISDHINMMGHNPLEGPNVDSWGPRFPDMSDPYSTRLRNLARKSANDMSFPLHEGVYVSVVGPNLETKAEYTMFRFLGADVVGMSTVPEVLVARHMGVEVLAFSVVTDECIPENLQPVSLEDVLAAALKATPRLTRLLEKIVPQL